METLYHYTGLSGFLGILRSGSIWATHTSYLSDASEFFHALEFAKQEANSIFLEDDYRAAFGWAVRDGLKALSADDLYVSSFSEEGDLLSQWRGYCPPGAGVCLGFHADRLKNFCEAAGYNFEQCIYSHTEQVREIREIVAQCFDRFPKPWWTKSQYEALTLKDRVDAELEYRARTEKGRDKEQAAEAITWLRSRISELAPLFKNQGFSEEAEWRIVAKNPREEVQLRASSSYIVPYIELQLLSQGTDSPLQEVMVGPNPNQDRCESSLAICLKSCGLHHVEVKGSDLPFNPW